MTSSHLLHGSESLCKLLQYLAEQSVSNPGNPVKEYQIATEVFGRPSDFDPRLDSTVRVQTGRLRSKLAEYYAGPGAEDPLVIELPKGSYAIAFHPKLVPVHPEGPASEPVAGTGVPGKESVPVPAKTAAPRVLTITLWVVCAALLLSLAVIAYLAGALSAKTGSRVVSPSNDAIAFRRLWKGFIENGDQPWVVFSNAEFVGKPETGLRYYDASRDSKSPIFDHYTGVGEVLGIHELDRVFSVLNHGLRVKRGRLLSMDDARNNDLIFVGSPSENLSLRDIPSTRDFVFKRVGVRDDLVIINVHPRGTEPKAFYASPALPLEEDYSLVALVPGMNPAHRVMLLAGITTIGTEAATEYVCRAGSIDELLGRLTGNGFADAVPFEAVLRVKVSKGVPVQSELVAVHAR